MCESRNLSPWFAGLKGAIVAMMDVTVRKSRAIRRIYEKDRALFLESEQGLIRIWPQTDRIIRVSYTENGTFPENQGEEYEDLSGKESSAVLTWSVGQEILVRTEGLTVRVNRETGSVIYEETNGTLLLAEADHASKQVEEFPYFRPVDGEARTAEIRTADGVKQKVLETAREYDRMLYHTRLSLKFREDEVLFGLGQAQEGVWNLRGTTQYLHQANMKIAIPVLLSGEGYAILLSTQGSAIFEDDPYGSYLYTEADEYLDYYFIAGKLPEVVKGIRMLTGKAAMLPSWAFGYIQSKERYETAEEIVETAHRFRESGFGLDAVVLDWMSWPGNLWGQKTLDEERFPDPKGMTGALHEEQVHFMISIWPNMSQECSNYVEFKESGLLLPNSNLYDVFRKEGRELYWQQAERGLYCYGVDGWWCDSSEAVCPEWERGICPPPAVMYQDFVDAAGKIMPLDKINAYGLYHARGVFEGQTGITREKRVLNLTRSGYPGSQKYGAILWSGDISATWDTLRKQVTEGISFCACGLPYWTLDIGAFFVKQGIPWFWNGDFPEGLEDPGYRELYVRWFQYGAFLPVFRSHGTDCPREPWNFGKPGDVFYHALQKAVRLRYELMPYIYSLAGAVWKEDELMMRPLIYDFPEDRQAARIGNQYMFGPALMVCPVTRPICYGSCKVPAEETNKQMQIYLPAGTGWYDYYTQEQYAGGQKITVTVTMDHIPLFVRAGAILPMAQTGMNTSEQAGKPIELHIYPGADGWFVLYEDAGDGYGYEQGEYCLTEIHYSDESRTVSVKTEGNQKYHNEIKVLYL